MDIEDQKRIYNALLEIVKKHHYSNKDFKVDTVNVIIYNACPLCGGIDSAVTREPQEEEVPGIYITRDTESCNNCANIKFLHPQIYIWVKQMYDNQIFTENLKQYGLSKVEVPSENSEETVH